MNKKGLIFIIVALLGVNIYTLIHFRQYRKQSVDMYTRTSGNDELNTLKLNLWAGIENSDVELEDVAVKDSSGNLLPLSHVYGNDRKQLLVCRFSDNYCESCVNFSIQSMLHHIDSIGKSNVLFLGTYRNNRIFNKLKALYHIENLNVYNIAPLNVPAEELGYPYYFILNADMSLSNVFVPDKATPAITRSYLNMINERYFVKKQS